MTSVTTATSGDEWTVDQLAQRVGVPVRTIREYQTMGLLHRPRRVGRVGMYDSGHLRRLELIGRLQDRGHSLAGIADLLSAWRDGNDIAEVLGLAPDQLVHVDEPGAPATLDQLAVLLPTYVPERLEDLLATGVIEACGPDRYCIPSPSLLQLTIDTLAVGLDPDVVLQLLGQIRTAADAVGDATMTALADLPTTAAEADVDALVSRGRGLLAHGVGRLALHRLGRRLDIDDDTPSETVAATVRRRSRSATKTKDSK